MGDRPLNDLSQIPDAAREILARELEPGEQVHVVIPGARGTCLVATDRRVAVWKDNALRSWSPLELSRVDCDGSFMLTFVALRGQGIDRGAIGFGEIAAASHAIQVTDKDRARLGVRAINGLIGRDTPALSSGGGGRPTGAGLEGAVMVARGAGGRITLFEDRIRIKHEGLVGLTKGIYKGDKEVPIDQITAIQWRDPGTLVAGHIQFTIMGGSSDSKAGSLDENSMMFNSATEAEFQQLKVEIERRMAVFRRARLGGAPAVAAPDITDQLRKLGELRELGVLTEEEFTSKKTELLARL